MIKMEIVREAIEEWHPNWPDPLYPAALAEVEKMEKALNLALMHLEDKRDIDAVRACL